MKTTKALFAGCIAVCGAALVATPAAAADQCVNPGGTDGCFATVQGAVDAAGLGDTVSVAPGIYFENVLIDIGRNQMQLVGTGASRGAVIIDPDAPNSGIGIEVRSARVTIENLTVRNGQTIGIELEATSKESVIRNVRITGADDDCLNVAADRVTVEDSEFRPCGGDGVEVDAHDFVFRRSVSMQGDNGCLEIDGDRALVVDSHLENCEDDDSISVTGDGARVLRNRASLSGSDAIEVNGNSFVIDGNEIWTASQDGIEAFGSDGVIRNNVLTNIDDDGIDVDGERNIISNNTVTATGDDGIEADGGGIRVVGNQVTYATDNDNGIDVSGRNPIVTDNTVSQVNDNPAYEVTCFDDCSRALVARNFASDVSDDDEGFDLDASAPGMIVEDNTAIRTSENGFEISGIGIIVRRNVGLDNGSERSSVDSTFRVLGDSHVLEDNVARRGSTDGFSIVATKTILRRNQAIDNGADGIQIEGSANRLLNNVALRNNGMGIEIAAGSNNRVLSNRAANNRTDFCDDGTGTVVSDNNFGTTGACAID